MLEFKGNMLLMDCDALVITTNGFIKTTGEAVMGRGIAKQVSYHIPNIKYILGMQLQKGNVPYLLMTHRNIDLVSFPVKPKTIINDGTNIVAHAQKQFNIGDSVPGFYAKAEPKLIIESAHKLVDLANIHKWETILVPRFGCGAGELLWTNIKPLVSDILDDRFIACTF